MHRKNSPDALSVTDKALSKKEADYSRIIESIFQAHFVKGATRVEFDRTEINTTADALGVDRPKNPGDVPYTFRYRRDFPDHIRAAAPAGKYWSIHGAGRGKYAFVLGADTTIVPDKLLLEIKIPDATPGVITKYALSDEQALLAKLRYNRLIDIFAGVAAYSLQSHLRTFVKGVGQTETDEVYVGIDKRGVHYVIPVQAKAGKDKLGMIQVVQDVGMCRRRFPGLICRPVCAQFMADDVIALFAFEDTPDGIRKTGERHFRLVPPDQVSAEDLDAYRKPREE